MKKSILSLIGILLAIAFAPQASALPLFARQTGMECAACHFQHFPMLTSFGRAFKAGGYTMMGAQGKVEGDNISLPNTLNMAILSTMGYSKNNSNTAATIDPALNAAGVRTTGDGAVYVPGTNGEFSLFVGGRVSENIGALAELGMLNDAGTGAGLSSAKTPMLWEVADDGTRAGVVPFTTGGQGASYGFETLNTGANAIHTMLFIGGDFNGSVAQVLSAQQYIGTATPATGAAIVVNNSNYFINLTKFHQAGPADLGGSGAALTSLYLRVAGLFDVAGWDTGVGVQSWSGSSTAVSFADTVTGPVVGTPADPCTVSGNCAAAPTPSFTLTETKAWAIDGQMQGELSKMPVGFYVTYARAPAASVVGIPNAYNGGAATKSSFNIAAELGVIPQKATIGFGIRRGKSGDTTITGSNASDNAYLLEASYKLAQNVLMNLIHTSQSGDYWNATNTVALGSKQTLLNVAVLW